MIKQLHKLMLLAVAALFAMDGYGYVKIDGVYYDLNTRRSTASVTNPNPYGTGGYYKGLVSIPSRIVYDNCIYQVTSIYDNAFKNCSELTIVSIPSSVTSIGSGAFSNSSELTLAIIPSSVTSIGRNAFSGCSKLYEVDIPSSVTSIESGVFQNCTRLTSITIPSSVTSIEGKAFYGCTGLTSVTIPSSVTSIKNLAFCGCSGLSSLTIPSSVTSIGSGAFDDCELKSLYLFTKLSSYSTFEYSSVSDYSVIFAHKSEIKKIQSYWRGTVADIELPFCLKVSNTNLGSLEFSIISNEWVPATLQSLTFGNSELTPNENGTYKITNLEPDTSYDILVTYKTQDGTEKSYRQTVRTSKPSVYVYRDSKTQTTMTLEVIASSDTIWSPAKKGVQYNGNDYYCTDDKVTLQGLATNTSYSFLPFAEFGTKRFYGTAKTFETTSLNPTCTIENIGPTSISVKGSYTVDDAHVSETGFTDHGTGNTLTLTGLSPNTSYTVSYYVRTEEGSDESVSKTFTTSPEIKLTTLQPKCVSSTCAIVAAETNIIEEETGVGFQWKKYDAPESLKPNEGYAAIHDGQVEGYIKNLQSTFYYNVRAFYKSNDGTYYYGDWVTFDPSDFSFFEPTVQTYGAKNVTENKARLNGYALAGTDEIEEQGFDYWKQGESEENARSIRAEMAPAATEEDVHTVLATGQRMSVELRDLESGTTYCFRAFVKTALGKTYGQEETFKTLGLPTGIDDVMSNETAPEIEGYYDLHGRKLQKPQHGINIIRYTDGTARKVLMK